MNGLEERALVYTLPEGWGDSSTNIATCWFDETVGTARDLGFDIVECRAGDCVKRYLEERLAENPECLLTGVGHGSNTKYTGYNKATLILQNNNDDILDGRPWYALSCKVGASLGKSVIDHGCPAFIGYSKNFTFTVDRSDPCGGEPSRGFMAASNAVVNTLLEGGNFDDAYYSSQATFEYWYERETDPDRKKWLLHDKDCQVAPATSVEYGDGSTIITQVTSRGELNGTVRDSATSSPIAGARVVCGRYSAVTDSYGRYIMALRAGTYTVSARADRYRGSSRETTVREQQETTEDFALDPVGADTGDIYGIVRDIQTKAVIPGAVLTCDGLQAQSGADGYYEFNGLAPGTYTVECSADRYRTASQSVTAVEEMRAECDFDMSRGGDGRIYGTVKNRQNGAAIQGAALRCEAFTTRTDARGEYSFDDLASGIYAVGCGASGYESDLQRINVGPGESREVNFRLAPSGEPPHEYPGSISGIVQDAASGLPLSGAGISCDGHSATTNAMGIYKIAELAPGPYTVVCSKSGYISSSATVTVISGQGTTRNFNLTPAGVDKGSIYGTVRDSTTGGAIAGAALLCDGMPAASGRNGAYEISGITPGTHAVTCNAIGYRGAEYIVTVAGGGRTLRDFDLNPDGSPPGNGRLEGIVRDIESSSPIPGAAISVNSVPAAVTDISGKYVVPALAPGTYTLLAEAIGYGTAGCGARIVDGAITVVDFYLPKGRERPSIWPMIGIGAALAGTAIVVRNRQGLLS